MFRKAKVKFAVAAFALASLFSGAASADYVCWSSYTPSASYSTTGLYGHVFLSTYSGAHCTGTFTGFHYFCTANATNGVCSADYRFSSAAILSLAESLQRAAAVDQRINVGGSTCTNSSRYDCADHVSFYAD